MSWYGVQHYLIANNYPQFLLCYGLKNNNHLGAEIMKGIFKVFLSIVLLSITAISWAIPNPAAVYCKDQGLSYVMVDNKGLCVFEDGSFCEEWAYFRHECKMGDNKPSSDSVTPENK
jgi:hypothetical protein